jgi:hypothetical protein
LTNSTLLGSCSPLLISWIEVSGFQFNFLENFNVLLHFNVIIVATQLLLFGFFDKTCEILGKSRCSP